MPFNSVDICSSAQPILSNRLPGRTCVLIIWLASRDGFKSGIRYLALLSINGMKPFEETITRRKEKPASQLRLWKC